jgi:hypothetical protein
MVRNACNNPCKARGHVTIVTSLSPLTLGFDPLTIATNEMLEPPCGQDPMVTLEDRRHLK